MSFLFRVARQDKHRVLQDHLHRATQVAGARDGGQLRQAAGALQPPGGRVDG